MTIYMTLPVYMLWNQKIIANDMVAICVYKGMINVFNINCNDFFLKNSKISFQIKSKKKIHIFF